MRRSPGFVAAMVLILALCVGADTAIFSVVHGIVLRPLPFPRPNELLAVYSAQPDQRRSRIYTSDRTTPISATRTIPFSR